MRRFGRYGILAAALALAGCTGAPVTLPTDLTSLFFPDRKEAREDAAAPVPAAPIQPAAATTPAIRPVVAVARPPALAKLRDLSPTELVALIGEPDFRRVEPPAELWQYRSADCVLDLFLYGDGKNYRVIHADARDRDMTRKDHARCGDGAEVLRSRVRENKS